MVPVNHVWQFGTGNILAMGPSGPKLTGLFLVMNADLPDIGYVPDVVFLHCQCDALAVINVVETVSSQGNPLRPCLGRRYP